MWFCVLFLLKKFLEYTSQKKPKWKYKLYVPCRDTWEGVFTSEQCVYFTCRSHTIRYDLQFICDGVVYLQYKRTFGNLNRLN